MKKINRKKLQENIWYFGMLKNLKIGEIEKSVGCRLGIVSRWANKDTKTIPLDIIYNIAKILGVTIDELISADIETIKRQKEMLELKQQREILDKKICELEKREK